ncbi:MAG TPA: hypothetical protein VF506_00160 [Streptosporangiaceae bacterium]
MTDFVAAALDRIRRADAAMDDNLPDRAKHERSLAHVLAVLSLGVPLESVEQIEGSEEYRAT